MCEAREEYGVPDCEGNPALLDCPTCKAFKGLGICSHVLTINHILKQFNVRYQLATIGKRTEKHNYTGGQEDSGADASSSARAGLQRRGGGASPSSGGSGQVKKVKAGKEGADTRILGVFSAYRGAHRQPRGRYMDLLVSHCIHMYPGGADRNTFVFMYRGCIGSVLCMMYPRMYY